MPKPPRLFERPDEVHARPPDEREQCQRSAVISECDPIEARSMRRVARGTLCLDVAVPGRPGVRIGPFELLEQLPRVLVVAGRGAGKTTLIHLVAAHAARVYLNPQARLPLMAPVALLDGSKLDVAQLARLNPAVGVEGVRRSLAEGRAAVFIDSLDEAESPEELKDSLAALAAAHPTCAFLATTRPLRARVAGQPASAIRGFSSVRFAPPALPVAPPYELEARRVPASRTGLVGAEVDRHLERWKEGPALGAMTEAERLAVAAAIALLFHSDRAIECSVEGLAYALPRWIPVAWSGPRKRFAWLSSVVIDYMPRADLTPLVDDLRACSGLLVENRPGVLAFGDIAFQEYLTAVANVAKPCASEMWSIAETLERRADPWWQPVLVCLAGLRPRFPESLPAEQLARLLFEEEAAADSPTTFLLSSIAAVVPDLPEDLQRKIERRRRASVPPRSSIQVCHFVDNIGDVAGPALVNALDSAAPNERAYIATTLGRIHHAPALRALARLAEDESRTTDSMLCWAWNIDVTVQGGPVAFFAFLAIFNLAISNPAAGAVFEEVLPRVPLDVFDHFFHLLASKLANDEYWGRETPPERDMDRISDMLESMEKARARRKRELEKRPVR